MDIDGIIFKSKLINVESLIFLGKYDQPDFPVPSFLSSRRSGWKPEHWNKVQSNIEKIPAFYIKYKKKKLGIWVKEEAKNDQPFMFLDHVSCDIFMTGAGLKQYSNILFPILIHGVFIKY